MQIARFAKKLLGALLALLARSTLRLPAAGQPLIYLDPIRTSRGRTLEQLLIAFQQAGYPVLIQGRINRWMVVVAGVLRWHPGARIIWRSPAAVRAAMRWTDAPAARLRAAPLCEKTVELRRDIFALEQPRIQQMRTEVIRYYREHLQLGDFVRRIAAAP